MPLGSSHGGYCGSRQWTDGYAHVDIFRPALYHRIRSLACLTLVGDGPFVRRWESGCAVASESIVTVHSILIERTSAHLPFYIQSG